MNTIVVVVIAFGVLFCVGGPILGHYVSKASEESEKEESNKTKSK